MSDLLAILAGKDEQEFKDTVAELEERSGFPSEDVRHLSETTQALRAKVVQLGLDPDDTTGEELYYALQARYEKDAASVDRALGVNAQTSFAERAQKAAELVYHSVDLKEVWTLKNSAAKSLIKQTPPKKLMKALHYRSVDSLLKREDIAAIFVSADLLEVSTWRKKVEAKLARLSSTSYELKPLKTVALPDKIPGTENTFKVLANGAVGSIALNPKVGNAPTLTMALLLIDGLESLSENRLSHNLHRAHPALSWWLGAEHLLMFNDGEPVSLNFKDVSHNHLVGANYQDRLRSNGHHLFWAGLMNRYRQYVEELPVSAAAASQEVAKAFKPAIDLVPELVEA